ncbi:MAG: hypothetical protein JWN44_2406 [Myxococcales bacterium]|nr:hypothetical protein [Myxococcales bacterium]
MNWTLRNALATVLAASLASAPAVAHGQVKPPEAVPDQPDEPLPEWHPPPPRRDVIHLDVAPALTKAQDIRQAGMWLICFGGAMMFGGGLLYARAQNLNDEVARPHGVTSTDEFGTIQWMVTNVFDPSLEDQKNQALAGSRSLLIIGGAFAATGFALFGVGQWRIRSYHKRHPRDPLPPLSGYEQVR